MKIDIFYCSSWGFLARAKHLSRYLENEFGGAKITLAVGKTSAFEVLVDGQIIHSNIGDGPNVNRNGQKFPVPSDVIMAIHDALPANYQFPKSATFAESKSLQVPASTKMGMVNMGPTSPSCTVSIQYCGGWGFGKHYNASVLIIKAKFPDVEIQEISDKGTTGNFEIKVNGVLHWSKKKRGQPFFDKVSEAERKPLLDAIAAACGVSQQAPLIPKSGSGYALMEDDSEAKPPATRGDIIINMCITLSSIPLIIGAWCWPSFALALFTLGASTIVIPDEITRLLTFILLGLVCLVTWTYLGRQSRKRDFPISNKFGPLLLAFIGGWMMMAEPIRQEFHDAGIVNIPLADVWAWSGDEEGTHYWTYYLFAQFFKWFGMTLLITGSLWNGNICGKLRDAKDQYDELMAQSASVN